MHGIGFARPRLTAALRLQLLTFGLGVDCAPASAAQACAVAYAVPNGAAERAGLTEGDLITSFDGKVLDEAGQKCVRPAH